MNLTELTNKKLLSVRSYNICLYNKLLNDVDIQTYYSKFGTFERLRNCGEESNNELINIAKQFSNSQKRSNEFEDPIINQVSKLNGRQRKLINCYIYSSYRKLSKRSQNAISCVIGDKLILKYFLENIFKNKSFTVSKIRNVGILSADEIERFLERIKNIINEVVNEKDEKHIIKYLLQNRFNLKELLISEVSNNSIVSICNILIKKNAFFKSKKNQIFVESFEIYQNKKPSNLTQIIEKVGLTRERIRRIRLECLNALPEKLELLTIIDDDLYNNYEIDINDEYIPIDDAKTVKINTNFNTNFNKAFLTFLFSIFLQEKFTIIGNIKDVLLSKQSKVNSKHNWKNLYLVNKEIPNLINIDNLIQDLSSRIQKKNDEDYYFDFKGYLSEFVNNADVMLLDKISPFCEHLINQELHVYLDENNEIVFKRNSLKKIHEYAFEALEALKKPSKVFEIHNKIKEKYPSYKVTEKNVRMSMKKKFGFVPIGKRSIFRLKKWEPESNRTGIFKFFKKKYIGLTSKTYNSTLIKMNIQDTKLKQENRLKEICTEHNVNYESMKSLLDSVKTKKLNKRNNHHEQTINTEIEKNI